MMSKTDTTEQAQNIDLKNASMPQWQIGLTFDALAGTISVDKALYLLKIGGKDE